MIKVVEGTGSYGAGLARALAGEQIPVVEVDRPDRRARRRKGKSDPLDALAAARAALSGEASRTPKTRSGPVEAIRALRVARRDAIKARTAAFNQLHGLIVSAPADARSALADLRGQQLVHRCAAFRVDEQRVGEPMTATKAALRAIARRIIALQEEIHLLDRQLSPLTAATAPQTTSVFGVSTQIAVQTLVTADDNPERLRSEAAFAHLCAAAPIPASSDRTDRHRRAEQALTSVVATRYLLGVSTRRMEKLVEQLSITRLSRSQVSVMAAELDQAVEAFRTRPLDQGPYTRKPPVTSTRSQQGPSGHLRPDD